MPPDDAVTVVSPFPEPLTPTRGIPTLQQTAAELAAYERGLAQGGREEQRRWRAALRESLLTVGVEPWAVESVVDRVEERRR